MSKLSKLYEEYKDHLESTSPEHYSGFVKLERNRLQSARAEAVTYFFLRSNNLRVENFEDPGKGGVDFVCRGNSAEFLVEVTTLDSESISTHSGVKNEIPKEIEASGYEMINNLIFRKAINKTKQLSGLPFPRVLAIATEHVHSSILFGTYTAELLLTGDVKIQVSVGEENSEAKQVTDLKTSVFFRFDEAGKIELSRQSISAILLIRIYDDECNVLGVLNPEPVVQLDIGLLPQVPFLRINPWPLVQNRIYTEWVVSNPESLRFYYPIL